MTEVSASQTEKIMNARPKKLCRGGYQPPALTHTPVGAGLLLRCPKFARRADDGFKFRPLPLLFARCIRHRRRSQTSPGRPVAKYHRSCGCCQGTRAADSRPYGRLGKCVQKGGQSRPPLQWVRFFACRARRPGAPLWRFVRESAHLTCSLFTVHHSLFTERDVRVLSRAADSRPY